MAKQFKIKAKERRELQRAIMRSIQSFGLVDTYSMKDSIRVMTDSRVTFQGVYIKITALYYYQFHDEFVWDTDTINLWNGGKIYTNPIMDRAFNSTKAATTFSNISEQYVQWLIDNNSIFAVANLKGNIPIYVGFEFFGSDIGKWNRGRAFQKWGEIEIK